MSQLFQMKIAWKRGKLTKFGPSRGRKNVQINCSSGPCVNAPATISLARRGHCVTCPSAVEMQRASLHAGRCQTLFLWEVTSTAAGSIPHCLLS